MRVRFLEVDPVEGGSANDYDYVGGDPVNSQDLNGAFPNPVKYVKERYEKAEHWRRIAKDVESKLSIRRPIEYYSALRWNGGPAMGVWTWHHHGGDFLTRVEVTARSGGTTLGDSVADTKNNRVAMRIGRAKGIGRDRQSARRFIVEACDAALYGPTRWGQLDARPE